LAHDQLPCWKFQALNHFIDDLQKEGRAWRVGKLCDIIVMHSLSRRTDEGHLYDNVKI
jgi:hypothetical protein